MVKRAGTINSIASEVGCSASTVSRVLGGRKEGFSVRPELEARIFDTARRYDYRPNPFVRALRAKKTKLIAVMSIPYKNLELVEGNIDFIEEIRKAGYSEAVRYVRHDKREDFKLDFPVDAALFTDIVDLSFLDGVERDLTPYVVVNGACGPHGASILIDEKVGVELLLEHLTGLGHRRIAYANNSFPDTLARHYSILDRERFYLEGLRARGLSPMPNHWRLDMPDREFLKEALDAGASAIVCYHHAKAIEIMHEAWLMGVKVPERLSIACFNDDKILDKLNPPVTSVSFPRSEMCLKAAELILSALSGEKPLSGELARYAGKLVPRMSTASAPEVAAGGAA